MAKKTRKDSSTEEEAPEPTFASEVDEHLYKHPQGLRVTTQELRKVILEAEPELVEELKWNRPCYSLDGLVCYLKPGRRAVTLGFYKGTELTDPDGLLQGSGKEMRHVKIARPDDIDAERVAEWIREAVRINQGD